MGQVLTTDDLQIVAHHINVFYSIFIKNFKEYIYSSKDIQEDNSKEHIQEDSRTEPLTLLSDLDLHQ
jgi:hypothetical protein